MMDAVRTMRNTQAAERFAERRRREDEAPRLTAMVPALQSCRIELGESRRESTSAEVSYTKRVIVPTASTIFLVSCGDGSCREGGHDISVDLIRGLRAGHREIRGEDACYGTVGTAQCGRILRFVAYADYAAA